MNTLKTNSKLLCLLLALFVTISACDNDDDSPDPMPEPQTITEIASANDDFSILVSALVKADLAGLLDSNGSFTVFAPTNDAFEKAGITSLDNLSAADLRPILLNHVVSGEILSTDLQAGDNYVSSENASGPNETKLSLYINAGDNVVVNNNATVTTPNLEASNGVIHVIDNVISADVDVVDIALQNSNFSELVGALQAAEGDLVSTLQGDGPFTVFAPTNAAFEAIAEVTAELSASELANVLTYHVVSGNVQSSMLSDEMSVTAINQGTFSIDLDGDMPQIMDASGATVTIVLTDVQGINGVVHVVNKVLLQNQ
ncbi:fasciclin domain-containing protein [Roseivirga pacifica]|uniref:fasciclin domain-containing protein n=1 Tax=Roseivirga pacifica TaxID=1267423 RepID=UPI00227CD547|nr:fasciclin domain-containing protein [Roseivirga pacifica]